MNTTVEQISMIHMIMCFGIGFFASAAIAVIVGFLFATKRFVEVAV